jgi:hypothetical protein
MSQANDNNKRQADLESMAWSVTRHTQIPLESGFRRLAYGIDSLDIGFYVRWSGRWEALHEALQNKKEQAQRDDGVKDQTPKGRTFFHLRTGKAPNYRYHLKFPEYHLFISITDPPGESPNVYVSILSESLWHKGVLESVQQVTDDLQEFHGKIFKTLISRCDLCVDFLMPEDPTLEFIKAHMVSRTKKTTHYEDNSILETFYAGRRGAKIQLRIYNKGKEIMSASGKRWFLKEWGLERPDRVWRVEFQIGRTALKEREIDTLEDLLANAPGLWDYLTKDWFSLRFQDNERQNRRAVHPWWQDVYATANLFGEVLPLGRTNESDLLPDSGWFVRHIGGMLPSYAARKGIREINDAMRELSVEIICYWFEREFNKTYDKRLLRLGFVNFNQESEGNND